MIGVRPKIYTRTGDDGTTGLLYGGRVTKNSAVPEACGTVDEAQAAIGMARALLLADSVPSSVLSDKEGLSSSRSRGADTAQADTGQADSDTAEIELILVTVIRDLWLLMAELAVDPDNRRAARDNRVTPEMVSSLEEWLDFVAERVTLPKEFVVPGEDLVAAQLDVARTMVRRAERRVIAISVPDSQCVPYLNRLSDLLWTLARWREGSSRNIRDI